MKLPLSDPQFWIATLIAVGALALVLRVFIPWKAIRGRRGTSRTTRLTVGGKPPGDRPRDRQRN